MSELDPALDRLHLCGFEYADGVPNYGPMAVAALESLGHSSLTAGLLDIYVPRLPELPDGAPLERAARDEAQGRIDRGADWVATFATALAERPWPQVLEEALAVRCASPESLALSPHAAARLGNAVHLLEREENVTRLRELAFALAYVFARGAAVGPGAGGDQRWIDRVRDARGADDLAGLLGEITLAGAERYLANAERRADFIAGVVAPSAFRALLPHLTSETAQRALISLLNGLEGEVPAQVATGRTDETEDPEVERCAGDPSEIRYRGACSVHEHAIVMTEACMREDALAPSATLRRAAADAALRLSPPGYREWR